MANTTPAFVVHTAAHVRAALAAAGRARCPVTLVTPPGGAAYLGLPYLKNMIAAAAADHPEATFETVLDAGDDAAIAHTALTLGWSVVVYHGTAEVRGILTAVADQSGARVIAEAPPALDLQDTADPAAAAEKTLAGH